MSVSSWTATFLKAMARTFVGAFLASGIQMGLKSELPNRGNISADGLFSSINPEHYAAQDSAIV